MEGDYNRSFTTLHPGKISILALVWRATPGWVYVGDKNKISILALVWRATKQEPLSAAEYIISILALVWRATQADGSYLWAV